VSDLALIGVSVVLLGLNAFFVGAEFALISARRTEIEPRAKAGSRAARITLGAMEDVSLMMAGAQLGITICSLGLGSLGEPAVAHVLEGPFEAIGVPDALLHPVSFVIALAIVVYLHVVVGEMVPKNIALAVPDRAALVLGPPLVAVVTVLKPFIWLLNQVANVCLRAVGVTPKDEITSAFTRDEVAGLVEESRAEGLLDLAEAELVGGALAFGERTVQAVLLPTHELVSLAPGATARDVELAAARTGFSRFPVLADDEVRGYVHLKDVLRTDVDALHEPVPASLVRAMPEVSPDAPLREVLTTLQRTGAHLAQVRWDRGPLLGAVALEDVLEELVGELHGVEENVLRQG
jgi:CBS domain containing-hemolysin-like protein